MEGQHRFSRTLRCFYRPTKLMPGSTSTSLATFHFILFLSNKTNDNNRSYRRKERVPRAQ